MLFQPLIFYSLRTIQSSQVFLKYNRYSHHTIDLSIPVLRANQGQNLTASSHIFCVLKWPRTNLNAHGSTSAPLIHISCVLKWSVIRWNATGMIRIILLQVPCVLRRWSGTYSTKRCRITFLIKQSIILFNLPGPGEVQGTRKAVL